MSPGHFFTKLNEDSSHPGFLDVYAYTKVELNRDRASANAKELNLELEKSQVNTENQPTIHNSQVLQEKQKEEERNFEYYDNFPIRALINEDWIEFYFSGYRCYETENTGGEKHSYFESYEQEKFLIIPLAHSTSSALKEKVIEISRSDNNLLDYSKDIYKINRRTKDETYSSLPGFMIKKEGQFIGLTELFFDFLFDFFHSNAFSQYPYFGFLKTKLQSINATRAIITKLDYLYYKNKILNLYSSNKSSRDNNWEFEFANTRFQDSIEQWINLITQKGMQPIINPKNFWFQHIEREHHMVVYPKYGLLFNNMLELKLNSLEILQNENTLKEEKKQGEEEVDKNIETVSNSIPSKSEEVEKNKVGIEKKEPEKIIGNIEVKIKTKSQELFSKYSKDLESFLKYEKDHQFDIQLFLKKIAEDSVSWLMKRYAIWDSWKLEFRKVLKTKNKLFLIFTILLFFIAGSSYIIKFYFPPKDFSISSITIGTGISVAFTIFSLVGLSIVAGVIFERFMQFFWIILLRYIWWYFGLAWLAEKVTNFCIKKFSLNNSNPVQFTKKSNLNWLDGFADYTLSLPKVFDLLRPKTLISIGSIWAILININLFWEFELKSFSKLFVGLPICLVIAGIIMGYMVSKLKALFPEKKFEPKSSNKILKRAFFLFSIGIMYSFWTGVVSMHLAIKEEASTIKVGIDKDIFPTSYDKKLIKELKKEIPGVKSYKMPKINTRLIKIDGWLYTIPNLFFLSVLLATAFGIFVEMNFKSREILEEGMG